MEGLRFSWASLVLFYLILLQLNRGVNCVELDPSGGYSIVVGISDNAESVVGDVIGYIDDVKFMLNNFSQLLWETTDTKFYIKSVQIVVPEYWREELRANISMKATYGNADIQFSTSAKFPQAENYYPCGKPGVRIKLPFSFSHTYVTDLEFGSQVKALLNLWLRYRFGVWEEHGYPHHDVTPYVYNIDDIVHSPWLLTSCNNSKLKGEFKFLSGSLNPANVTCDVNGTTLMRKLCRFYPDLSQREVASSLMNFQWVQSVVKLCDEDTHDKHAPNRQNLYCDFRSVWEIIRSSDDFKTLNETGMGIHSASIRIEHVLHDIEYNIVVRSPKPILYILLDVSRPDFTLDDKLYDMWLSELTTFVNRLPEGVVTKLATYPNTNDTTTDITVKVEWSTLDSITKTRIRKALNFSLNIENYPYFDFRLPLAEVISELKTRSHPHGAVLLVLRTTTIPYWDFMTIAEAGMYEEDFLLDLKQHRITLNAIEVNVVQTGHTANATLHYLATNSNGLLGLVRHKNGSDASEQMKPVLQFAINTLTEGMTPASEAYEIIYKEKLADFSSKSILIPKRIDIELLHIYVSISRTRLDYIRFQLPNKNNTFSERSEWTESNDALGVLTCTYSMVVNVSAMEGYDFWAWELYMTMKQFPLLGIFGVKGIITIYGTKIAHPDFGPESSNRLGNTFKAEIYTSAVDNTFYGCHTREINEEPLAIFVKLLTEDNEPILFRNAHNTAKLERSNIMPKSTLSALLLNLKTGTVITAILDDHGIGADLVAGDGVYSGYVYPHEASGYRVFVVFYDAESKASVEVTDGIHPVGRVQSSGQDDLEFSIEGITLKTPYSIVVESPRIVRITSACIEKRYLSRVVDAHIQVTDIDAEIVEVSFTVPVMIRSPSSTPDDDDDELNSYYMGVGRFSEDINTLINDKGTVQAFVIEATPAGRTETVLLKRNGTLAFAMELIDFRQPPTKSNTSNIARVRGWRVEDLPPTEGPPTNGGCNSDCVMAIGLGCGLAITLLIALSFFLWRKNRRQRNQLRLLSRDEINEFLHGNVVTKGVEPGVTAGNEYLDCSERIQSLPYDSKYEIPNSKLHIDKTELLGSGTFGNVHKGYVVNFGGGSSGKVLIVAVKTMKPNMDKSYFKALLGEVKLMTHIGGTHPNIVKLVGACTKNIRKCEVFLATEFCANGNLSSYLLKLNNSNFKNLVDADGKMVLQDAENNNNYYYHAEGDTDMLTTLTLIKWSREIANGMNFLGTKKIVHGDLAARNILLDEDLVAKISDFGLSKQVVQYQYGKYMDPAEVEMDGCEGGLLPWKWLSPEALSFNKFSVASDVWAYGVTIWEIFSLGQVPYPGIKWSPDFISQLEKNGLRLLKPNFATDTIYEIMQDCWKQEPRKRPGFNAIKTDFDQMMLNISPGDYMDLQLSDATEHNPAQSK